jgi:tetratricopeptide (TPR) repeat protein
MMCFKVMKRLIRCSNTLVLLLAACHCVAADGYADVRAELVAAYQAQDYDAMILAAEKSLLARPEYPSALFNLALAFTLNGDNESSLRTLNRLLAKGVDYGADEMDEFAALRELTGWEDYLRGVEALYRPYGEVELALQSDRDRFVPEGIAISADGSFYLGSIRRGLLLRDDEVISDRQGHWSVFGMRFHDDGSLWFASAAVPQLEGVAEDNGKTGLFRLDVGSGAVTRAAILPQFEFEQVLGDLVIAGEKIYTTDSLTGAVYRYDIGEDAYTAIVERGELGSPQGLVLDATGDHLYVADYIGGLYRISLSDGATQKLRVPSGTTDYGIDGLYRHGNKLVAIQNGIELDDDGLSIRRGWTLVANLPEFDEPTLGVVRGDDLYFVANSHWNRFDRDNRLPEGLTGPIILKLSLLAE